MVVAIAGSAAILLAASAPAGAATYCVHDASCSGTHKATIETALHAAQASAAEDTIRIGPGTYYGEQHYQGASAIHILGAGRKKTKLTGPDESNEGLTVEVPTRGSSVRSLTVAVPPGSGFGLILRNVDARRVHVTGPAADGAGGVTLRGGSLRNSRISLPNTGSFGNLGVGASPDSQISDVSIKATLGITGGGYGVPLQVARARITVVPAGGGSRGAPPAVGILGDAVVRDSLIDLGATAGAGLSTYVGTDFSLPPPNTEVDADHVTIVGGGLGSVGFYVSARGTQATGMLDNSVIFGPAAAIARYASEDVDSNPGTANVTTDYSSYDAASNIDHNETGGAGAITATNFVPGTPSFVDPSVGNFRPVAGSILVDAGDPAFTPQLTETDLDRGNRVVDGDGNGSAVTDVGAYERENSAPSIEITSGPRGSTHDSTPKFKFQSDDPAASFECELDSSSYKPCMSPKRYSELELGGHSFRVRPTDAYGNVGVRAKRRFRIVG